MVHARRVLCSAHLTVLPLVDRLVHRYPIIPTCVSRCRAFPRVSGVVPPAQPSSRRCCIGATWVHHPQAAPERKAGFFLPLRAGLFSSLEDLHFNRTGQEQSRCQRHSVYHSVNTGSTCRTRGRPHSRPREGDTSKAGIQRTRTMAMRGELWVLPALCRPSTPPRCRGTGAKRRRGTCSGSGRAQTGTRGNMRETECAGAGRRSRGTCRWSKSCR